MNIDRVLVSGAGIAGPALAWWLARAGARVTIVERAPSLRPGGHNVDFRGPAHMTVLERMGLTDTIRAHQTHMGKVSILDSRGKFVTALPSSFMSGDVEIPRGDLSRVLYASTKDDVEYVFGDSIAALDERDGEVEARFERTPLRSFDLVIGADGIHSVVRALVFGKEEQFLRFHDHYAGAFTLPNLLDLDHEGVIYSETGRGVSVSGTGLSDPAQALFVFRSPELAYDRRDMAAQKAIIASAFAGAVGWKVPQLLEALAAADDLYFDSISSVAMRHFTRGRIALVGDAAYGGTLGGQGTGLAIVAAYVLAGELAAASNHADAFRRYEERIRPYATNCQGGLQRVGPFFAPRTSTQRWMRDRLYGVLASRPLQPLLHALTTRAARSIELESYPIERKTERRYDVA